MRVWRPARVGRLPAALCVLLMAPAAAPAQQDSSASLRIQFAAGGSVFQTGETIALDLLFSAGAGGTYQMTTRNYDRSGRLDIEEFHLSPPGRDPLHDHYSGGIYGGFIGGGIGGDRALSADPETMREDLNEWLAPDQPGHYSLYVTSSRVSRRDGAKLENLTLRSNTLEFDVVEASPAWQAQTLDAAAATLRSAAGTPEEKRAAARTLRFLDTPDAVRELARQLAVPGDDNRWDMVAGIVGSRHRQEAVAELEAQLAAPDAAVTAEFLRALAETKFLLDALHAPLTAYPEQDKRQQDAWRLRQDAQIKQFEQLQDELYAQAVRLAASKRGAARAETVRTVLLRPSRESPEVKPPNGLPEAEMASVFGALTPRQQSELLEYYWERVKTPAMARVLEAVLEQPGRGDDLRGLALQRLFELDPRAGRPYILAEIRGPQGTGDRLMAKALTLLPDETLPEFDEVLAARLESKHSSNIPLDARLVGRYATVAILPRVQAVYEKQAGRWACDIEDGLVTYFLRVAPDYGLERVRAKGGRCMPESVKAVVAAGRWSGVEPAIIARLDEPDVNAVRDAAEILAQYGGAKAQRDLFRRLRAFHKQWADREAELVLAPGTPRDVSDAVSFEFGLVEALGHAQAWLLDNDRVTELERLTLGSERQNVERWHWHSPVGINLTLRFDGEVLADINGQFNTTGLAALEAKLVQYPSGTVFQLNAFGAPERLVAATRAIHETASHYGLVVEDQP